MVISRQRFIAIMVGSALGVALAIGGQILTAEDNNDKRPIPLEDVQRFSSALSQIKNYYVKSVDDKELFEDAIRGMLSGLDPHSSYLDEAEYKDLHASTKGEFGGLGIEVTMEEGVIKVISPIDDTPAARAGVKAGDYIVRLDKTPVKGMTLREAVSKMRGKKGSSIDVTILRKGETKPIQLSIKRDVIIVQSVKSRLIDKYYGYLRISHFQAMTSTDAKKAVEQLQVEAGGQLKGLILDLRNNPGGLLESAIQVSDAFIHNDNEGEEEMIVYTKGRLAGSKFTALATPGDILNKAPIVVLINGGSASGSEIVAGALRDNRRAVLIGTKSFGKGSVQTVLPLDGKRGIKLTTALYYTPLGTSIQAKGIAPDIEVEQMEIKQKEDDLAKIISEADLNGHLDEINESGASVDKAGDDKHLIYKDYQLFEALNVLKGISKARHF